VTRPGVELLVAPAITDVAGPRTVVRPVAGLPLLHVEEPTFRGPRRVAKDIMDRVVAAAGLLVLLPVFTALAVAIRIDTRGPIFFRQGRVGRDGRRFDIVKFRTMVQDAETLQAELRERNEAAGVLFKLRDDPRVTRVGGFLRRWSIDELPQLWNVLRGEMSLVGPRPPLPAEVARYEYHVSRRLLVKPGMTGLWQVSGRSDLHWDEAVRLDLYYVDHWSPIMDGAIILRTFMAVVRGNGAY
jgi:exopolysaccharide biosynthesis polyprenyl glycosylphosphotransferase